MYKNLKNSFLVFTYICIATIFFCSPIIAQNTVVISDGNSLETNGFYPKFSWGATQMYYMFGDLERVLIPEEMVFIGEKTDFICIEKSHGLKELGSKYNVVAFKKLKPVTKVLFYFNSAYAWPFTPYNKNFTQKNIDQQPDLKKILIIDPETKEFEHRRNTFFFDVLNPEFRDFWVNTLVKGVDFSEAVDSLLDYPELQNRLGDPIGAYTRNTPDG
jgi:hypothetical protein